MQLSPSKPKSIPGMPHEQQLKNWLNFSILQVNWNLWFVLPRARGTTDIPIAYHFISFTSAGHSRGAHGSHVPGHHSINWCLCRWRHKMCHNEECNSNGIMHSVVEFLTNGQKHPHSVFIMIRAQSICVLFWSKHFLFDDKHLDLQRCYVCVYTTRGQLSSFSIISLGWDSWLL